MEEVDEIVLHTLRQIGCDLEEISSLKEFTTETAIDGVVRCLKLINTSLELPNHVPQNMSARYRLGSTLASICTDLGYKGEIGYQTFLYSNETDLRKIFLFLFEHLPKESEKALDEPMNKLSLIIKEVGCSLSRSINMPWLPHYCKGGISSESKYLMKNPMFSLSQFRSKVVFNPSDYAHVKDKNACKKFCDNDLRLLSRQLPVGPLLLSSILESNAIEYAKQSMNEDNDDSLKTTASKKETMARKAELIKTSINGFLLQAMQNKHFPERFVSKTEGVLDSRGSRFTHALELQFTPDQKEDSSVDVTIAKKGDSEEEMQKKRESEIKELQERLDSITAKFEDLALENKNYEASVPNLADLLKREQGTLDELKEKYRVKNCTLSLLPDAESNIKKLQTLVDGSTQKLVSLANQWEQHRVPLINQYRDLRELSSRRVNETQKKLEEIKVMREKIRNLGVEARQKEDAHKHLVTAYEKLTKDVSRSSYTRRIMEIVGNIKKQKAGIDKVLLDTRNVQKEINRLSGMLERTFTVTDELIFKDAKKDEAVRRAYKYLAALHENCSQLVIIVEETGAIEREIREIEDQIEQENQKKVAANLERIASDYKQMQQENATLLAQLK